jgi:hypothetical protein
MPSQEPNSKMDELLRAYAKKRREQAEPVAEMHPATRRLLQDEVKRTLTTSPTPTRQSWRAWRWPLAAMWGGMAVMLFMFAMLNRQLQSLAPGGAGKEEGRRMKDEKPDRLTRNIAPAAPPRAAESAARDARRSDRDDRAPQEIVSAVVSTAPAGVSPAAPAAVAEGSVSPVPMMATAPAGRSGVPVALGAPPPSVPAAESALVSPMTLFKRSPAEPTAPTAANDGADATAGNFVQIRDRARKSAAALPPSNLLSNFRMSRSGQNVSIVDADGSVYNGQVLNENFRARGGRSFGAQQNAKAFKDTLDDSNWTFNVTGFNNSLNEKIIFTGNVLDMPWTNAFSNGSAPYSNRSQFKNALSNGSPVPSTQNSRITGKVQVGGGKPFEIEAKPPSP